MPSEPGSSMMKATRGAWNRSSSAPAVDLSLPRANETALNSRQVLENLRLRLGLMVPRLLFEIPSHTDRMRAEALPLARRWRLAARRIFEHCLTRGYGVLDFAPPASATGDGAFTSLAGKERKRTGSDARVASSGRRLGR